MALCLKKKEKVLSIAIFFEMILHLDVWAWDRIHPIWLGTFPYHVLWGTLEVATAIAVFLWWGAAGWADVTDELIAWGEKFTVNPTAPPDRHPDLRGGGR